jgi:hypothetical protein
VFGGEAEIERILASMNNAVLGSRASGSTPGGDEPHPDVSTR